MNQKNNSNARLLKMISGLQNQITRLERKQPYGAVFYGTNSEDISLTANTFTTLFCDTVIMNQGIYFAPVVDGFKELRWIVMSSGMYMISFSLFFVPTQTASTIRMFVGDGSVSFPTTRYVNIPIGNSSSYNATSGSILVYLEEGWTFYFDIAANTTTTLTARTGFDSPSPLIHIAQVSGAYETPSSDNEWYFEANEIEPR